MIKILKLVNDHEIIGTLVHESVEEVVLEQPFTIQYLLSPKSGRPIIGLLRYMPFAEQRAMSFKKADIINMLDARKSMILYYESVVLNHLSYVDDNIDYELESVAEAEMASGLQDQMTQSDLMADFLNKFNNNGNVH